MINNEHVLSGKGRRGSIRGGARALHRRQAIAAVVAAGDLARVADLADRLSVSEMTIRRDFEALEDDGVLVRVHGGAVARIRPVEPFLALRSTQDAGAKQGIGAAAASLLRDGETAGIDGGTTALELARSLRGRRRLKVVTPSILAACELGNEPGIQVLVAGGTVRPGELSLVGSRAEEAFREITCDVAFIGVAGVHADKGFTDYNDDDTRVKRRMIDAAARVVVLADASKLGRVAFAFVAPFARVDTIVTDAPANHSVLRAAARAGVQIVVTSAVVCL